MTTIWTQQWPGRGKIAPAIAALMVNAIIGYALILGLRGAPLLRAGTDDATLALFNLDPPVEKTPEPVEREKAGGAKPSGRAVPALGPLPREQVPNSPVVTPAPVITVPEPLVPSPAPPMGAGDGVGSGGEGGTGTGGGSGGNGGAGIGTAAGDGGAFSPARQIGGRFRNSDFPAWLRGVGRLKIGVRYAIGPSGHVDQCEIIEKSGYAEVDQMTCRIIVERYRFRPARDPAGYAVTEVREEDYRWRVR